MEEIPKDKRFKSWGSEFETPVVTPYAKKMQSKFPISKSKIILFRIFFKLKEFWRNFLK